MKINKLLFTLALAGGLLAGCNKDDNGIDPDTGGNANGGGIVFNIGIENPDVASGKTRTTTTFDFRTTFVDGDEIGLYAVSHAAGAIAPLAASDNAIHNVKLTYSSADGGKWTLAAPIYYIGAQMDFYAYYPYDASATDPLNITFNVQADQSTAAAYNKSDLLWASATNIAKSSNAVTLTFTHKLAMVQVEVDPTYIDRNGGFTATLRGCKVGGAFNLGTGGLTTAGDAQKMKMLRVETNPATATTYTYRALVPVQTVASGTSLCLMTQNEQLYGTPALATALDLAPGDAKLYTAKLPATALQTVKIPKGTFTMGSPITEPNRFNNETQHQVTLTKDFYMSKYAVTFAQYDAFCEATSRQKPADQGWGRGDRPVIFVNWNDAVAYCTWLSSQTGQTWTLPTEAQWEYACRAGTTTPFGIGDGTKLDYTMANFYWHNSYQLPGGEYGDTDHAYPGKTSAVGSYTPNAWGLYDMHGNVLEWCSDWNGSYASGDATDPTGAATGSNRVLRGGSWGYDARKCRSASRDYNFPAYTSSVTGFRVVFAP